MLPPPTLSARPQVSVVVPALNEAAGIGATLASVARQSAPYEILVAVGDSDDGTAEAAQQAVPEAQIVHGNRGRACQMNDGATLATGDVLLFLHADTRLSPGALDALRDAMADPTVAGGCFRTAFDLDPGRDGFSPVGRTFMRLWESRLWMRWHRFAFGDRALFVRRSVFQSMGGFPEQPIFEDLDAVRALRRHGRFVFLDAEVTTSARRFRQVGAVRQQLRNLSLWTAWNVGVSPSRLKRFYSDRDRG